VIQVKYLISIFTIILVINGLVFLFPLLLPTKSNAINSIEETHRSYTLIIDTKKVNDNIYILSRNNLPQNPTGIFTIEVINMNNFQVLWSINIQEETLNYLNIISVSEEHLLIASINQTNYYITIIDKNSNFVKTEKISENRLWPYDYLKNEIDVNAIYFNEVWFVQIKFFTHDEEKWITPIYSVFSMQINKMLNIEITSKLIETIEPYTINLYPPKIQNDKLYLGYFWYDYQSIGFPDQVTYSINITGKTFEYNELENSIIPSNYEHVEYNKNYQEIYEISYYGHFIISDSKIRIEEESTNQVGLASTNYSIHQGHNKLQEFSVPYGIHLLKNFEKTLITKINIHKLVLMFASLFYQEYYVSNGYISEKSGILGYILDINTNEVWLEAVQFNIISNLDFKINSIYNSEVFVTPSGEILLLQQIYFSKVNNFFYRLVLIDKTLWLEISYLFNNFPKLYLLLTSILVITYVTIFKYYIPRKKIMLKNQETTLYPFKVNNLKK
jgi:hypothetical protein